MPSRDVIFLQMNSAIALASPPLCHASGAKLRAASILRGACHSRSLRMLGLDTQASRSNPWASAKKTINIRRIEGTTSGRCFDGAWRLAMHFFIEEPPRHSVGQPVCLHLPGSSPWLRHRASFALGTGNAAYPAGLLSGQDVNRVTWR
ncbi:hypothetical protein DL93DRAFT_2094334 [Clavulina sp. PMI_390]|nr:hypothetical protein DL93DRAFT_2094334 [Clavulina sp. PMI_390]